ncbi:TonB-dependent receptor [Pedobacter nanyangensis]|uniref:TonB-dependent receptor n=1 Tax=Pedobacter nanyangensis TaxID=1562389 RepID=UPI0013B471DF|nr:TonB-dependent receptor [Pedobacter nanyangensis]
MKLTALFILSCYLNVSATVYGQNITLKAHQIAIEKVFEQIEQQSSYSFFYNEHTLANTNKVNMDIRNSSIDATLTALFKNQPLTYEILDKTIVVKRKEKSLLNRIADYLKAITINGKVVDESGQPLPGAGIKVKGTTLSTTTNSEGQFTIANAPDKAILLISFIGYEAKEITATPNITITLLRSNSKLDEVQVMGYGTTTKRLNTGNISTVKADVIEKQPVTNPILALSGRVAGLQIAQDSSLPGAAPKVRVRGQNSMNANNDPLYIIDGVPLPTTSLERFNYLNTANGAGNGSPLNTINPNDIASIEILKDADATSIYGSRGANGVILITTKKGNVGKPEIKATFQSGFGSATQVPTLLSTSQYVQVRKDGFANSNATPTTANAPELLVWDQQASTDFQDLQIGATAKQTDASLSLSGGSKQITFLLGGNFHNETTLQGNNSGFKRGGAHLNLNYVSDNGKLQMQSNTFFNTDKSNILGANGKLSLFNFLAPPNFPLYNADGSYHWRTGYTNPKIDYENPYKASNYNLNSNLSLEYKVIEKLSLKANVGYGLINNRQYSGTTIISQNPASNPTGTAAFFQASSQTYIFEPQIAYKDNLLGGNLSLLAGATLNGSSIRGTTIALSGYTNDLLLESQNFGSLLTKGSTTTEYRFASVFGRLNYNGQDKYLLNATFRRDGSTRFGPNRQFGNFFSIGSAWVFTNEALLKNKLPWLSYGKLRGSYGTTGSDGIGDYQYLNLYRAASNYGDEIAIIPTGLANNNFQWEVNKKSEIGLELGAFNNRIVFNTAWYLNRSSNQLVTYALPTITGYTGYTANLPAVVQNKGWEFELETQNITNKDFQWSTSFNLTIPNNKLVSFPGLSATTYANSYVVGQSLGIVQRYHFLGIDPQTGEAIIEDVNGDGAYQARSSYNDQKGDYVIAGKTDPYWYAGLNNSFQYKGFELNFFFNYVKQDGYNLFRFYNYAGKLQNVWTDFLGYWKQPGDLANLPKPTSASLASTSRYILSDATVSDASFLRLRNVSISYQLPAKWLNSVNVKSFKVYAQAQNLLTFSNYVGYDPELPIGISATAQYPPNKLFVFGGSVNF